MDDYKKERENLDIIKRSKLTHPNILLATGSLIRGNVYSLYFEAAKYDLDKYLRSPDTSIPSDAISVHTFLGRFLDLIDALRFLHNELVPVGNNESLRFFHLDLKPTNIMVFIDDSEKWKIHDFGMSRVSNRHHQTRGWERILPTTIAKTSSSGTTVNRSGSFLAPETHLRMDSDMGKVNAKSDVWSLGCILSLVISFLDQGPQGIDLFEKKRKSVANIITDHFFVENGRGKHVLNPGVTDWFKELEERFRQSLGKDSRVLLAIRRIIYLLKNNILLIKSEGRASAQEMKKLFGEILQQLNTRQPLKSSDIIPTKGPLDRLRLLRSKEDKAPREPSKQFTQSPSPKDQGSPGSPTVENTLDFCLPKPYPFIRYGACSRRTRQRLRGWLAVAVSLD